MVVKQNCSCSDPVEASYNSSTLVKFKQVRFFCGINEDLLVSDVELKRELLPTYPI